MHRHVGGIPWVFVATLLASCGLLRPTAAPTAVPGTALPEASPEITPTLFMEATPAEPQATASPNALTMWLPDFVAPLGSVPGGSTLAQDLDQFRQAHPGLTLEVLRKKPSGQGGLLDFLQTASTSAPSLVPDVMVLSTDDLARAQADGLLRPLKSISPTVVADLFPVARQLGTVDGQLAGLVFMIDCPHLAYDAERVKSPPTTWSEVLSTTVPYVFPVGDNGDLEPTLAHYLSAGGHLTDESGRPTLEQGALMQMLAWYTAGREAGVIPLQVMRLNTLVDDWKTLREGGAGLAEVPASLFLTDHLAGGQLRFATSPGRNGPASPLATGWALVLTTRVPARQAVAIELIEYLTRADVLGRWLRAAGRLPGRRAALETWPSNDAYTGFAGGLLSLAQPAPSQTVVAAVGPALRKAIQGVLVERQSPEQAAITAVEAVRGP